MHNLAMLNAELLKCRSDLEAVAEEVNRLASRDALEALPQLKDASARMREIAARIETLTRAIAQGTVGKAH
jgi:hypothetical protein